MADVSLERPQQRAIPVQVAKAVYPDVVSVDAEGLQSIVRFKAWVYNTGKVFWELRRVLLAVLTKREKLNACKVIAKEIVVWKTLFQKLALCFEDHFKPSSNAAKYNNDCDLCDPYIRQEHSVSTVGLVILLNWWSESRHAKCERAISSSLLLGFYEKFCLPDPLKASHLEAAWLSRAHSCQQGRGQAGLCMHGQRLCVHICMATRLRPAEVFIDSCIKLRALAMECVVAGEVLACTLGRIAEHVDSRLDDMDLPCDATREKLLTGSGRKRLRIDEDFKEGVANDMRQRKKIHHGSQWLRSTGACDERSAREWEEKTMTHYMAEGWIVCHKDQDNIILHIAEDAKRLGMPAQPTQVFAAWVAGPEYGFYLPPQVMRDWHGQQRAKGGSLTESSLAAWSAKIQSFFLMHKAESEEEPKRNLKQRKQCNVEHVRGFDHSLTGGTGVGLSHFVPKRRPLPVDINEERYMVEISQLPEQFQKSAKGRTHRCCIVNKDTRQSRFEVVWDKRPLLHSYLDQASDAWVSRYFLIDYVGLRMAAWPDPPHRWWNRCQAAFAEAGLNFLKVEATLWCNMMSGPWKKCGNYWQLQQAANEYFQSASYQDQLFQQCYDLICEHMYAGQLPRNFGSREHQKDVWNQISKGGYFGTQGHIVKINRWFAFNKRVQQMLPKMGVVLLLLLYVLVTRGTYTTALDTPLVKGRCSIEGEGDASPEEGASGGQALGGAAERDPGPPRAPVASRDEAEKKEQKSSQNVMHLVAQSMASSANRKLAIAMVTLAEPVQILCDSSITLFKTQGGCLLWSSTRAAGDWEHLCKIVRLLSDKSFLLQVGLAEEQSAEMADAYCTKEAMDMSDCVVHLVRALLSNEIEHLRLYSDALPGKFAGLVHDDQKVKDETLSWCRRTWDRLVAAELQSREDRKLADFLRSLLWPRSVWVREILIGLAESQFTKIPSDLERELRLSFRGWASTKVVEDTFNSLNNEERQSKGGKMGATTQWHRAATSGLLPDMDRVPLPRTPAGRTAAPPKLPPKMFEAEGGECSVPEDDLAKMDKATWPTPSVHNHNLTAAATFALLGCDRGFSCLHSAWLSLLCQPMSMIWRTSDPKGTVCFVLSTSVYGVIGWRCVTHKSGGFKYMVLDDKQAQPWQQIVIHDIGGWRARHLKVVPPCILQQRLSELAGSSSGSSCSRPSGIVFDCTDDTGCNLIKFAAQHGFKGMSVPYMQKLITHQGLEVPNRRPTLECEVCRFLVQSAYPESTKDEIEEMVKARSCKYMPPWVATVDSEKHLDDLEAIIDENDMETVKKVVTNVQKESRGKPAAQKPKAKPKSGASSAGSGAPPRKPTPAKMLHGQSWTAAEAKAYLPQVKGCAVTRDVTWHHRWKVSYPCRAPPYSVSKTFVAGGGEREALLFCLRWAWSQHEQATGEVCQWSLEA